MLDKDPLFARLTLDDDELFLYDQIWGTVFNFVGVLRVS